MDTNVNSDTGRANAVPAVILPCPPDKFSEFIAGLLGRPQTIEAAVEGPFTIARDDVVNLYHLIGQRISSQNEASLIQFTARIVYNNKSSVRLTSLADFGAYNEVKPLVSTALHLSWTYLIKFPTKPFPEKQVIQMSFRSEPNWIVQSRLATIRALVEDDLASAEAMTLRIEHTDRTWGTDLEALITGQLRTLQTPVSTATRLRNRYSGAIGFLTGSAALVIALVLAYLLAGHFDERFLAKVPAVTGPASLDAVQKQIQFLETFIVARPFFKVDIAITLLALLSVVGAIVLGSFVSDVAYQPPRSFVLLSAKAANARQNYLAAVQKSWLRLGGWIAATLALGVASNVIFYLGLSYLTQ